MEIHKPKRISLSAQIVREMERIIRDSEWNVGGRIPPEGELMRLFDVSRNTVREAVQSLIHAGLLEARPGDGTYVRGRTRMESVMRREMDEADPEKVLEARLELEIGIAGLASKNRTPDDLQKMRAALDKRNLGDDPEADAEFHLCAARASHNPLLSNFYSEICRYMLRNLAGKPMKTEVFEHEKALHEAFFRAVSDGDAPKAKALTLDILQVYRDRLGLPPAPGKSDCLPNPCETP